MAGICGWVGEAAGNRAQAAAIVRAMAARLRHRGPEAEEFYLGDGAVLGWRSLRPPSAKPLAAPAGGGAAGDAVIAFCDGEVYNAAELRQDLRARGHRFRGEDTAELLVHLYQQHGESLPRHLEGIFAFALWDAPRRSLLLARDRFGVKPLYYAPRRDGLSFASELGALRADAGWDDAWDWTALDLYLQLHYIPAPYSAYAGARKLAAGHALRWRPEGLRQFRYWFLPERLEARAEEIARRRPRPVADSEQEEELWARLRAAVRRRLTAEPVGLVLNGRLETAAMLALLREAPAATVQTFAVGAAQRSSRLPAARRLARRLGAEHHELRLRPEAVAAAWPAIAASGGEPLGDPRAVPLYFLAQAGRPRVAACMVAAGALELLAGRPEYAALALAHGADRLPRLRRGAAALGSGELWPPRGRRPWSDRVLRFRQALALPPAQRMAAWWTDFNREQRRRLWRRAVWPVATRELLAAIAAEWPEADWLNQTLYCDLRLRLADGSLAALDRMTMAHGLEVRAPWLDTDLALFLLSLPGDRKLRHLRGMHLLRRAVHRHLPAAVGRSGGREFSLPLGAWLRGPLRRLAEETLSSGGALDAQLDRDVVAMMLRHHWSGQADYSRQIWNLMVLAQWMAAAREQPRAEPAARALPSAA
jgi:asparagine synthase (glutamine-hydrolysing)